MIDSNDDGLDVPFYKQPVIVDGRPTTFEMAFTRRKMCGDGLHVWPWKRPAGATCLCGSARVDLSPDMP